MRRWSLLVVLVMMASVFALSVPFASEVSAATLYVGGGGPGNHTTIQAAIDAANPGDTVYVFNGTYFENVVVNKTMSLIGESRDATIIDGGGTTRTAHLLASWVNISGFTFTGGGGFLDAGVELDYAHNCNVSGNNVSGNGFGIALHRSDNNTFADNMLHSNFVNIALYVIYSTNATIIHNTMSENGIYLDGESLEHWNSHTIDTTNTVDGDPVYYWKDVVGGTVPSDAAQVILANCSDWLVEGLNVDNTSVAIQLGFSSNNTIANNTAVRNQVGVVISDSRKNVVTGNNVSDNYYGIHLPFSDNNTVFHNIFINNTRHVITSGPNRWDNGYPSGGNYWGDYVGTDDKLGPDQDIPGSDGIGDTPYQFPMDEGTDLYPLMGPDPPSFVLPSLPLRLQALDGDDHVNLTWEPPLSDGGLPVVNYSVYRGTSRGQGTFQAMGGNVTSFSDANVTIGVTYYYSVAAVTFVGEGPRSIEVPGKPGNLHPACTVTAPAQGSTVSGIAPINGTASDPDGTVAYVEVRIDDGRWMVVDGSTSWTISWRTRTSPNGNHTIYARSFDGTGYSAEVAVTVFVNNTALPPPEDDEDPMADFWEFWTWAARAFMIVMLSVLLVGAIGSERKRRKRRLKESEARDERFESKEDGAESWKGPAERIQGYFFVVFVNAIVASSLFLIALTVSGVTLLGGVLFLVVSFSLFACYIMVQMKEWR
ncbi:MAG: right-handed parallel beta-helix repeat-containing protein [Candidatus Thermoplasmatota archaeon]|nr:right-handed parallel beta-helix repeat-containing protein [Candidatus Thermoplasmatota archaeon]